MAVLWFTAQKQTHYINAGQNRKLEADTSTPPSALKDLAVDVMFFHHKTTSSVLL